MIVLYLFFHRLQNSGPGYDEKKLKTRSYIGSPSSLVLMRFFTKETQNSKNNTGLIIRMDYPNINVIDQVKGVKEGEVDVTGSIVFVSDHSVFANHLWIADADVMEKQCDSDYADRPCWDSRRYET